jgi:hypothetical protein
MQTLDLVPPALLAKATPVAGQTTVNPNAPIVSR